MKWAKVLLSAAAGCLLLYNAYFEHVIKASVVPSKLQKEVLADRDVSKEEALLLVAEKLKNEGKSNVGVSFQSLKDKEYICTAKWEEAQTAAKTTASDMASFSVNKDSGAVEPVPFQIN